MVKTKIHFKLININTPAVFIAIIYWACLDYHKIVQILPVTLEFEGDSFARSSLSAPFSELELESVLQDLFLAPERADISS